MNKISFLLVATLCAGIAFGAEGTAPIKGKKTGKVANLGGLMVAPINGRRMCLINDQKIIPEEQVRACAQRITQITWVPIEIAEKPTDEMPLVITLNDSETDPRMLIAPEDGWAKLNLRKILADSPTSEVAALRLKKEVWRVFSYLMGAGNPMMQPSLLRVVKSNADLDSHESYEPWPDALNSIQTSARAWNLAKARITTYRRACQEGWAPMPTNDIQKAIWERTKAEQSANPTKALQIKYDPKVGK